MLGRRHPTLEVFAVEDTTAQVMWQSLGPGTLSLAVDGHVQDLVTSNGPGAATLTGLAPDSDVRVQARHPDLGRLTLDLRTLPAPPGRELYRFATVSDLHLGIAHFDIRQSLPALTPAEGERRGRVAFFDGCVMPEIFGDVNRATVRVLAKNGFDVLIPEAQGCCGALHAHAGDADRAADLARRNAAAFADVDVIVVNSAGCGAAMKDAGELPPRKVQGWVRLAG